MTFGFEHFQRFASAAPVERRPGAARSPKGRPRTIGRPASPRSPGTPAAAARRAGQLM